MGPSVNLQCGFTFHLSKGIFGWFVHKGLGCTTALRLYFWSFALQNSTLGSVPPPKGVPLRKGSQILRICFWRGAEPRLA
jgi:hypothetical protein